LVAGVESGAEKEDGGDAADDLGEVFGFVLVEGTAQVVDEPGALRRWAAAIGGRYMGPDRADAYGERNAVPGELLVRLRPTRITAQADVAD